MTPEREKDLRHQANLSQDLPYCAFTGLHMLEVFEEIDRLRAEHGELKTENDKLIGFVNTGHTQERHRQLLRVKKRQAKEIFSLLQEVDKLKEERDALKAELEA